MTTAPYSIYDAPETLAGMVLQGTLSRRGVMDAMFNPGGLSPVEREGVTQQIKEAAGNTSVGNALVDTALNPWVWLFLVTSPPGAKALEKSATGLVDVAGQYLHGVKEQGGMLRALGFLTGSQVTDPNVQEVAFKTVNRVRQVVSRGGEMLGAMPLIDIEGAKNAEELALREENAALLRAKLDGYHTDAKTVTPYFDEEGKVKYAKAVRKAGLNAQALDAELQKRGLAEYETRIRSFLNERKQELFGKSGSGAFEVDPNKVLNVWRGLKNPVLNGEGKGMETIRQFLSDDILAKVAEGELGLDDFRGLVKEAMEGGMAEHYMPRNTFIKRGVVPENLSRREWGAAGAMGATPAGAFRDVKAAHALYDEEGMAALKRALGEAGVTDQFEKDVEKYKSVVGKALEKGESVRMLRMDPVESLRRYNNDTARTIAWHVDVPTDSEWQAHVTQMEQLVKEGAAVPHSEAVAARPRSVYNKGFELHQLRKDMAEGVGPLGYGNRADLMLAGWLYNKDAYSRKAIESVLVPAVSGKYGVDHYFSQAVVLQGQRAAKYFTDSWLGKNLKRVGGYPEKLMEKLEAMATLDLDPESAARKLIRGTSEYMYLTTLGGSLSSVLLNMTQPFGPASVYLGTRNVLKGMGSAIGEVGGYIKDRLALGVGDISDAARAQLIRKHFKYADTLGIGPNAMEQLDHTLFVNGTAYRDNGVLDKLSHYLLGAFSMGEWFNRSTVGHAVENAFQAAGRATHDAAGGMLPEFERSMRRMSLETQFGSHPMNTPLAFMTKDPQLALTGSVLTNPLARQFLPFMVRSFTTFTHTTPRIGGRTNAFRSWFNDFSRGMAISAVGYEFAKNMFGLDVSRMGYFDTTFDLVPGVGAGGKFQDQNQVIPTPPIVSNVLQAGKALTSDDREMMGRAAVRMLPGGAALARALDVLPDLGPADLVQHTYVGWGQRTPDGKVPVFTTDGRMADTVEPVQAILHGVGADLGWWGQRGNTIQYLVSQREEMNQYRTEYVNAMLNGDRGKAEGVSREFEKRWRMPLRVTQSQVRQAQLQRESPQPQRVLQRMPVETRQMYAQMTGLAGAPGVAPVQEQAVQQGQSPGYQPFESF